MLPLVFPLVLLLVAAWFFFGRIGFWSDDYWYNLRDPVSGEVGETLVLQRPFFQRPLYFRTVPPLATLLWNHDWAAHLIQALAHGFASLLLFVLLRRLGCTPRASVAAALAFMVYPAGFETVLWFSALPTVISIALMLSLMLATVAVAQRRGIFAQLGGWWTVPVMMAAAFAICSLNEQPAAGIAALPLIYAAARMNGAGASAPHSPGAAREAARAIVPAALCGVMVVLYAYLLVSGAPPGARGATGSFLQSADVGQRFASFVSALWRRLVMTEFAAGALELGWKALAAHPLRTVLWLLALAAAFIPFLRWWVRPGPVAPPGQGPERTRTLLVVTAGAVIFLTGLLPILVLADYGPDSRMLSWPSVGLAMILAAALSGVGRPLMRGPRLRRPVLAAGLVLLILPLAAAAVMMIGVQSAMRIRWERDQHEAAQLRQLIPHPEPLTFFIPIDIEGTAVQTGSRILDRHFRGMWEYPWVMPRQIMHVYRRNDVRAGFFWHWTPGHPVAGADESGIHYTDRLGPRFPQLAESRWLVPWERALLFIITSEGDVRVVTRVLIEEAPGGQAAEMQIPQAQHLPDFPVRLPRVDVPAHPE